jgi:Ser-tRNA(Ala) deacylase AlaX
LKAEKNGKKIVYTLSQHHKLQSGDEVLLRIDWETRYRLMKLHFAAELVLEVINQLFKTPEKI